MPMNLKSSKACCVETVRGESAWGGVCSVLVENPNQDNKECRESYPIRILAVPALLGGKAKGNAIDCKNKKSGGEESEQAIVRVTPELEKEESSHRKCHRDRACHK